MQFLNNTSSSFQLTFPQLGNQQWGIYRPSDKGVMKKCKLCEICRADYAIRKANYAINNVNYAIVFLACFSRFQDKKNMFLLP